MCAGSAAWNAGRREARRSAFLGPADNLYFAHHRRRNGTEMREAVRQFGLLREEKKLDVADGCPVRELQMLHS